MKIMIKALAVKIINLNEECVDAHQRVIKILRKIDICNLSDCM